MLRDHNGKVVATGLSPPILITDDHKSNPFKKNGRKRVKLEQPSTLPPSPTLTSSSLTPPQSIDNEATSPLSSQQNDGSILVDYANSNMYKQIPINKTVPSNAVSIMDQQNPPLNTIQYTTGLDINMAPLSPISSPEMNMNYSQQASYTTLASTSASIANPNTFDTTVPPNLSNYRITNNMMSPSAQVVDDFPHINIKTEPGLVNESHLNNFSNMPLYNIPNTTASMVNNQLLVDQNIVIPSNNVHEANQKLFNSSDVNLNRVKISSEEAPYINRLIPNEGPISGGIEVTVLGVNFMEGLVVLFGDTEAQTQYYSESTLICILPPAPLPGPVPVSVKSYSFNIPIQNLMIFNYKNETDKQLMELALQVVGLRMTGKIDDARSIAMKIVSIQDNGDDYNRDMGGEGRKNNGYLPSDDPILKSSINVLQRYIMDLNIQNKPFNNGLLEVNSLENEVIQCLATIMSPDEPLDEHEINLSTAAGQTLLHFAVLLNMTTLVKWLIALDIDIDSADINGNTPLHLAVLQSNPLMVNILVSNEADLYGENCNGQTPLDIAYEINNDTVIDIIEDAQEDMDSDYTEEEDNLEGSDIEEEDISSDEYDEVSDNSIINEKEKTVTENVQNIDNIVSRSIDCFETNGNRVKQRKSQQNLSLNRTNSDQTDSYNPSEYDESEIYEAKPVTSDTNGYKNNTDESSESKIISPEVAVKKTLNSRYRLLQKELPQYAQYAMSFFGNKEKNANQTKSEKQWFQNIQQMPYFANFPNLSNLANFPNFPNFPNLSNFTNFPNFTNFSSITAFNFSFTNPFPSVTQHWIDLRKKQFDEWRLNQSLYTLLKRDSSAVIVNDDDIEDEKEKKKEKTDESSANDKKSTKKINKSKKTGESTSDDNSEKEFSEENEEYYQYYEDYDYDEYIENGIFESDPRLTERQRRQLAKQKHSRENRKRLRRDRTLFLFWIPTILGMYIFIRPMIIYYCIMY